VRELTYMNDLAQIKFQLEEAELYLRFLSEDIYSVESIRENVASQISQLLKEATKRLRESANLLHVEIRGEGK